MRRTFLCFTALMIVTAYTGAAVSDPHSAFPVKSKARAPQEWRSYWDVEADEAWEQRQMRRHARSRQFLEDSGAAVGTGERWYCRRHPEACQINGPEEESVFGQ